MIALLNDTEIFSTVYFLINSNTYVYSVPFRIIILFWRVHLFCHWQATNYFKLRTRLSINLPSRKRKSSAISGRLPSPIIMTFLCSLSAICRACRGSLTEEAKPQPPEEIDTTCYREIRRTLPCKVYVQEESVSASSEESNGTVSNILLITKKTLVELSGCFCVNKGNNNSNNICSLE